MSLWILGKGKWDGKYSCLSKWMDAGKGTGLKQSAQSAQSNKKKKADGCGSSLTDNKVYKNKLRSK